LGHRRTLNSGPGPNGGFAKQVQNDPQNDPLGHPPHPRGYPLKGPMMYAYYYMCEGGTRGG